MLPTLEVLLAALAPLVDVGSTGIGAIAGVLADGCVQVGAVGDGLRGSMDADAVVELHCAAKPLIALAVAEAVDRSGWEPDRPIADLVPEAGQLGGVTVPSLVHHAARIARPAALHWVATPPNRRPTVADLRQLEPGRAAYSEVGAGLVLTSVLAALGGRSAAEVLDEELLGPIAARGDVTFSPRPIGVASRLEPVFADLPATPIPMLHPLHPAFLARQHPGFGGYATAEAYLRLLDRGMEQFSASPILRRHRGSVFDEVLRREVDARAGFLVAGDRWPDGTLISATSIANVTVVLVPEARWAAFVFVNGLAPTREDAELVRRLVFADALAPRRHPR